MKQFYQPYFLWTIENLHVVLGQTVGATSAAATQYAAAGVMVGGAGAGQVLASPQVGQRISADMLQAAGLTAAAGSTVGRWFDVSH